ncbi:WSC-domain-containing protein [Hyaloscypha hepaticicola]|uniref:WSC-domain-containing protein n=1 Tax=Hyaloscypha hepaticicola TaxID=2082293 RepID=A0A2J6PUY4_9HELO|nr:WSC-domain-containing protein [Hyaloscypha hepaticicola]
MTDYDMFGVEYSGECYCGNTLQPGSVIRPSIECDMTCDGAPLEFCGGSDRLNVYSCGSTSVSSSSNVPATASTSASVTTSTSVPATTSTSASFTTSTIVPSTTTTYTGPPTPSIVQTVLGYEYIGCYTEATNSRALSSATYVNYNTLTVQICASFCGPTYSLFGVEWSGECYCGNVLQPGSVLVDDSQCSNLCDGNNLEYCGGGDRLNVYSAIAGTSTTPATTSPISNSDPAFPNIGPYSYYGCQTEGSNTRALNAKTTAYDTMTLESCAGDCAGYIYFGTEYGRECYCGNSFSTGSEPAPQDECTFPCAGDSVEICGAGLRLSVYSTSTPVVIAGPSNPATVGNYDYYGCMTEGTNSRALQGYSTAYDTMTLASCAEDCTGFEYFGTEYSRECYCGNSFSAGAVAAPEADCQNTDFLCMGDDEEFCGGSRLLSVYQLA